MNAYPPSPERKLPERNPVTHQKHRQEVLRQITLPLLLGLAVLLTLAILVVITGFQGGEQVSIWADISTVWLIMPAAVRRIDLPGAHRRAGFRGHAVDTQAAALRPPCAGFLQEHLLLCQAVLE